MMTLEQFLNKPKAEDFDDELWAGYEREKATQDLLPVNWKDSYFQLLEATLCFYRDDGQIGICVNDETGWMVDGKPKRFKLSIEQLDYVAATLEQKGFSVKRYFSILYTKNPFIDITWPKVDNIKKPDIV